MNPIVKIIPSRTEIIRLELVDRDAGQPRKVFSEESIKNLAENIRAVGFVLHPIYVKPNPEKRGRYLIVAGERRFRALKLLGVEEYTFHISEAEVPSYLVSLIENNNREDLNPIDQAESYEECMRRESMSVEQLSQFIGKHFTEIYRSLRLLKLAPEVKEMIRKGKLTRGGAHTLVQFKAVSKQIELARQLIAGEDPPEIDELLTRTSGWSESRTIASLPKTAEGLIRRLLKFRRQSSSTPFLITAFLDLSEAKQIEGWRHFTKATRDKFVVQLRELIQSLQDLEKKMTALPETKMHPFGRGIVHAAASAQKQPEKTAPAGTSVPKNVPHPPSAVRPQPQKTGEPQIHHNPPPKPVRSVSPDKHRQPGANTTTPAAKAVRMPPPPSMEEINAAARLLSFITEEIENGRRNLLGRSSLMKALGNGASPENVDSIVRKGFRTLRSYWRTAYDPSHPGMHSFITQISRRRHDLACDEFDKLLRVLKARDNSPDPINIEKV
ncbi:MAG: ParB/RepB/Spo0J family partition protein [Candidatus Liptonbacteria bacterium]|nr:ParB/RepB/Spo0J family partition protein [Candidatus Liptonbacteria bacterium]